MKAPNERARARLLILLGVTGAAVIAAAACSLTNLDGYTSGGGVVDSGHDANDGGIDADAKTDARIDTTANDDGLDSGPSGDATTDVVLADSAAFDARDAESGGDVFDAADAVETGDVADTIDTALVVDTGPGADTGVDPDAPCGVGVGRFGMSEIMVRALAGPPADKHEWIEFTNYDTCGIDISGVTVRVVGGTTERAAFTFPTGTTLAAGEAVVIADDAPSFAADLVATGYVAGKVFDFAKPSGDVLTNGSGFDVRLFAPGSTSPYETATVSRSAGWPANRSYAYPPPTSVCPASARYSGGSFGTLTATWKDATIDVSQQYGTSGGLPLYGSPTKSNIGIACP